MHTYINLEHIWENIASRGEGMVKRDDREGYENDGTARLRATIMIVTVKTATLLSFYRTIHSLGLVI